MNVLILTPDAVGSTLLQRLITIYMQLHEFDKPVINLHELTNGITEYFSPEFNQSVLGKPPLEQWDYYQSLDQITKLLQKADHYVTARLAEYHIQRRQDTVQQQVPFYEYLNRNFFIISCRRKNLFEHGISQSLNRIHKKLNIYSAAEKIHGFFDIYRTGVDIEAQVLEETLNTYASYQTWCSRYFEIGSYFYYEQCMDNLEQYILNLPIFSSQPQRLSWQQCFDIDFESWNRCHFYSSDIGTVALEQRDQLIKLAAPQQDPAATLSALIPVHQQQFLLEHKPAYDQAQSAIDAMIKLGVLVGGVPIKKQTLWEKLRIVRNLDQCVDVYNRWAEQHADIASTVNIDDLMNQAQAERSTWQQISVESAAQLAG